MRVRLACLVVLVPQTLFAADLELASRIDRVTVYPDAALVTRLGEANLPSGASTLILRGLPASLDPASIRVEGQGDAGFTIGAVDVRLTPGDAKQALDPELESRITRLRDERDSVVARIGALETKRAAIERYAQASPEKLGVEGKPFEVSQWHSAWDAIGAGLASAHEELRQARARQRDLDAEIAALERARPLAPRPGAPKRDVAVAVEASSAVRGELRVSYRVGGASWTPLYDARLDTGAKDRKAGLELVRRAQVTQRTGEDWSDAELAVSTVRVNRGTAAPDLPPLQVAFYEPQVAARPAPASPQMAEAARQDQDFRFSGGTRFGTEPTASRIEANRQEAILEVGAFQATFRVPGRVTVSQDGLSKTFALGTRKVEPALAVSAAPELDETAYLKASFTHEEEAPLLPGEVALHRDGSFVGRGRIKLTASGDTVDLGFGADDRVKVTRVPLRRRESEPGWVAQNKTDQREFKTSVKNLHAQPIRITVTDRLPFSENSAITVEQLRETTAPTEKGPADKRGVLAWTWDYAPGEQKEIRLAYRLRWPADREVVFQPKPNGGPPRS
jgi:uncharacterized protein (TIGR02231 family)